jgi:hypothetical protein
LQWEWLKADLIAANANRTSAPWIVVNGHRPLYCSSDKDCDEPAFRMRAGVAVAGDLDGISRVLEYGLEQLFYDYSVDLYICGHQVSGSSDLARVIGGCFLNDLSHFHSRLLIVTHSS